MSHLSASVAGFQRDCASADKYPGLLSLQYHMPINRNLDTYCIMEHDKPFELQKMRELIILKHNKEDEGEIHIRKRWSVLRNWLPAARIF